MAEEKVLHYFQFKKSDDYKRIHASGFWGGVSATGELFFEIYEDIFPTPSKTKLIQDEQGIREVKIEESEVTERILHVGVTVPMEIVPNLIRWLQEKLEVYENEIKNRKA